MECELVKLQPDYTGVMDIINYYADLLSLCAESAGTNLVNSKLSYVFGASSKSVSESLKKLFDKVASGEPAAFYDKDILKDDGSLPWQTFEQNLKQNYILSDLLSDLKKILDMFYSEIGIPNANTDKRERLVTDEVNSNNIETECLAALWLERLQESCEKVNDMFDIGLSVDWRWNNGCVSNDSGTLQLR